MAAPPPHNQPPGGKKHPATTAEQRASPMDFDLLPHGRSRISDLKDKALGSGKFGIDEHGNARGSRPQLTQEPMPLRPQFPPAALNTPPFAPPPPHARAPPL